MFYFRVFSCTTCVRCVDLHVQYLLLVCQVGSHLVGLLSCWGMITRPGSFSRSLQWLYTPFALLNRTYHKHSHGNRNYCISMFFEWKCWHVLTTLRERNIKWRSTWKGVWLHTLLFTELKKVSETFRVELVLARSFNVLLVWCFTACLGVQIPHKIWTCLNIDLQCPRQPPKCRDVPYEKHGKTLKKQRTTMYMKHGQSNPVIHPDHLLTVIQTGDTKMSWFSRSFYSVDMFDDVGWMFSNEVKYI